MSGTSLLDRLYACRSNRRLFFGEGWGDLARLKELCRNGGPPVRPPQPIEITWEENVESAAALTRRGSFPSPYTDLPLPAESRRACFELVLPRKATQDTPICLHFAATGDEGYSRRRHALALPLLKDGIGSLILENPYYGRRRPAGQQGKMLNRFSDLIAMGGATLREGRALVAWLRREGYGRLGVCGISMGGSMAARVAVLSGEALAVIGCVTAHSASAVFTEGILKHYLAWDVLDRELDGDGPAVKLVKEFLDVTDLLRSPPPRRPEAAFLVAARRDAYIPAASAALLHAHWRGSTMRWLGGGHVGAFLFHRRDFVTAIRDAFTRL